MNSAWARTAARLLVALMIWTPFQLANAAMIGTGKIVASSVSSDRAAVAAFVSRADVARRLQALGVDPAAARARVAAMTGPEARLLAGQIQSAPAGGNSAAAWVLVIVIAAAAWWYFER